MKLLLDTNIILDVLLGRGPWLAAAGTIWQASQDGRLVCCMTASSVTDIYFIVRKVAGQVAARQAVRDCLDTLIVLSVGKADLETAWASPNRDFEDSLQLACAIREGVDALITRDVSGFPNAPIPVWSPADLIARLPPNSP